MIKGKKIELWPTIPGNAIVWRNDPHIWKWCRQFTLIDGREQERWGEKISTDPTIKMFGVWVSHDGVGVCGLTSIDRVNQTAEFSLYIAPEFQNKHYGEDALRTLCRHGFRDHNLNRIWGEVFDGNPAMTMFEKVGFKREGVLKQHYFRDGKFIDAIRIGLLREDFN